MEPTTPNQEDDSDSTQIKSSQEVDRNDTKAEFYRDYDDLGLKLVGDFVLTGNRVLECKKNSNTLFSSQGADDQ